MNMNSFKQNVLHTTGKLPLAVAFGLLATLAVAAQTCPNARNFGERPGGIRREDEARRVQVQAVYFRTDDKDTFISETSDRRLSSSTVKLGSEDLPRQAHAARRAGRG